MVDDQTRLFDPAKAAWEPVGLSSNAAGRVAGAALSWRQFHTATLLPNGKVLFVGGISQRGDATPLEQSAIFDPVQDRFIPATAPLVVRYAGHTATPLRDGTVLIAGGMTDNVGTLTSSAELYDPSVPDPLIYPPLSSTILRPL